ncbi:MAG TPA: alpha-L-fucosidase [Verrucomicrobiae bacterium]|nr:alpha-L-fucosidase [Verrucomicrobiae bacterium]
MSNSPVVENLANAITGVMAPARRRGSAARTLIAAVIACAAVPQSAPSQDAASLDPYANETKEQRDARMGWWREAKFGMFIHWGIYAVPAGTYKGKQIAGIGEWIMRNAEIPVADYRAFARQFNPVKYRPETWAKLAKEAGMRYMVITSKHHDGFALFPSDVTDWDVTDATPCGKDLIGPLANAARTQGLRFGLYYSQAQDWTHPGGAKARLKEGEGWDDTHKGSFDSYLDKIAAPQVKEILARYQPDILWWDTPAWMNKERADRLITLIKLRPGLIHNNRLGGGYKGDTETPEQHIPATGFKDRDWEVCMTMNDTWGFKSYDENWKSTTDLIQKLCDIVSKGGNFLLNVGPTPEGEIPQPSIERLHAVGAWMKVNGEAIYGTTASPFHKLLWGRCTKKVRADGTTLYLHVFDWPKDGKLVIPGLKSAPKAASLLSDGTTLQAKRSGDNIVVDVPAAAPDPIASVVKLEIPGPLDVESVALQQGQDGKIELTAPFAELNNPGYGSHLILENKGGAPNVGGWTDARAWIEWTYQVNKPGSFKVAVSVAAPAKTTIQWGADERKQKVTIDPTGGYESFKTVELGTATIDAAGPHKFALRTVAKDWKPINVRSVTLTPAAQ